MPYVALLCALTAAVFLVLWIRGRKALAAESATVNGLRAELAGAEAREAGLRDDLAAASSEATTAAVEAEASQRALTAELAEATSNAQRATSEAERHSSKVAAVESELDALRATAAERLDKLVEAEQSITVHRADITALTLESEAANEALVEAHDAAARRRETSVPPVLLANSDDGEQLDVPGFSPATAWELELVRSERTWRYSVATNPIEDESPFADAQNPLRLAIEVEALALREDVGAFIGIVWEVDNRIDPSTDPARAHLTLRLAQEMLAAAAREAEPSELRVTMAPDGGISMQIVAVDGNDVDFKIPPPPIASEWIDVDAHGGLVVTIKAD